VHDDDVVLTVSLPRAELHLIETESYLRDLSVNDYVRFAAVSQALDDKAERLSEGNR
jgi:hypothetical protein